MNSQASADRAVMQNSKSIATQRQVKPIPSGYWRKVIGLAAAVALAWCGITQALTLNVVDGDGNAVTGGFRWMLEEDTTHLTVPGVATNDSISLVIHKSHAPVMATGSGTNSPVVIAVPDANLRYVLSVLADGYTSGGQTVAAGQTSVVVTLNKHPIPTAQISIFVFNDKTRSTTCPTPTRWACLTSRLPSPTTRAARS